MAGVDLTGRMFHRLTVVEMAGRTENGKGDVLWRCNCSCGTTGFVTRGRTLKTGETRSCGCLRREHHAWARIANPGVEGCEVALRHIVNDFGWAVVLETIRTMREKA